MSTVPGSTNTQYPSIRFNVGSEDVISQISFDVRDFIPGNIKPILSGVIPGAFILGVGTVRFGTPDDTVGADGDWFADLGDQRLYEKIAGQYAQSNIRGGTLSFTYQGWRAIGAAIDSNPNTPTPGRVIPGLVAGGEVHAVAINAMSTFTGDVVIT